jgi:hypothetical protein
MQLTPVSQPDRPMRTNAAPQQHRHIGRRAGDRAGYDDPGDDPVQPQASQAYIADMHSAFRSGS